MYFILKSTLCLFLFWGFYKLFLEREKMFVFNRFYLLTTLVLSFVIPFITIEIEGTATAETLVKTEVTGVVYTVVQQETLYDKMMDFLPFIYGAIALLLLLRLSVNIYKVVGKTKDLPSKNWRQAKLIFINQPQLPHAFLKYIFINKSDFDNGKIESELLTHELQHVRQRHSYDIIFIEIVKAILWFNPLIVLYEKAIKLNHEFLADEGVINNISNVKSYQYLLLAKARYSVNNSYLASSINYLITKKRLEMMTKKTSKWMAFAKKGLAIGLMIVLCFSLSNHVMAQTENGATESEIKEYKELMKKYAPEKGNTISIYKKDVDRMNTIYNKMSVEQRKKYPKIELPAPPPPPTTPKAPKAEKAPKPPKAPKTKAKAKSKAKVKEKNKWKEAQKPTPPTPPTAPTPPTPPKAPKAVKGVQPVQPVAPKEPKVPVVKGIEGSVPPPPPPVPPLKFDKNADFYINGEKATYDEAVKFLEKGKTVIHQKEEDGKVTLRITSE